MCLFIFSYDVAGYSGTQKLVFEKSTEVDPKDAAYVVQANKINIPLISEDVDAYVTANMHGLKYLDADDKKYLVRTVL